MTWSDSMSSQLLRDGLSNYIPIVYHPNSIARHALATKKKGRPGFSRLISAVFTAKAICMGKEGGTTEVIILE